MATYRLTRHAGVTCSKSGSASRKMTSRRRTGSLTCSSTTSKYWEKTLLRQEGCQAGTVAETVSGAVSRSLLSLHGSCHHLSELLSSQKRLPLAEGAGYAERS